MRYSLFRPDNVLLKFCSEDEPLTCGYHRATASSETNLFSAAPSVVITSHVDRRTNNPTRGELVSIWIIRKGRVTCEGRVTLVSQSFHCWDTFGIYLGIQFRSLTVTVTSAIYNKQYKLQTFYGIDALNTL